MAKTPIGSSPDSEVGINTTLRLPPPHPPPPRPYDHPDNSKWFPWLVPTIVTINIVVFVIVMYINNCPANSEDGRCIAESTLSRFRAPKRIHCSAPLLKRALEVKKVVDEHEYWRLLSCMWLHAGAFHVLANMLSLLFVGIGIEQEFGFFGASGALFGLLGSMLSELFINWTIYENKFESVLSLTFIILINMAVGILPHVDNFAHLGGFVSGFLLGFVILIRPQYGYVSKRKAQYLTVPPSKSKYKPYQCVMLILAVILLVLGFTVSLVMLLRGVDGNNQCSWCHYMSCVPTPLWTCEARCTSVQYNNSLNLTCMQNHKTRFYTLDGGINSSRVQELCSDLCL